jgi:hypothetical protein
VAADKQVAAPQLSRKGPEDTSSVTSAVIRKPIVSLDGKTPDAAALKGAQ